MNLLSKIAITLFCLWHMLAVVAYSPTDSQRNKIQQWFNAQEWWQPYSQPYTQFYRWGVRPYILLTSQWQRWNLFSPDPLRRITNVYIDKKIDDNWKEVKVLKGDSIVWYRRAKELKLTGRIDSNYRQDVFKKQYLQNICRSEQLKPETTLRWRKQYYVIPRVPELKNPAFWETYKPDIKSEIILEFNCDSPVAA